MSFMPLNDENNLSHAFVVPAYGRSPYLEACLASLRAQAASVPPRIVICTSTPFDGIEALAVQYGAELVVHGPNAGIGNDWNAALNAARADLVTIAHQDDIYAPGYLQHILRASQRCPQASLYFCHADEITEDGTEVARSRNLAVKDALITAAFLGRSRINDGISRRILLGLANPVTCPAVTINRKRNPGFAFRQDLRTNMDWLAWIQLASTGPVVRIPHLLMHHRVHGESETSRCLEDGARAQEDRMVFESQWPRWLANLLFWQYRRSYTGYIP